MKAATFAAFIDELGKIKTSGILQNVGTRIVQTAKPLMHAGANLMSRGWHAGSGWMGAGKQITKNTGVIGKAYENITSLGGLTKHLPVGPKSLTVGFGALGAKDALKKEDSSGQGRSRAERIGSLVGGTAAGIAGGTMGLPGAIATGVAGDYLGGRVGRAIKGRKAPTPQPEVTPAATNG